VLHWQRDGWYELRVDVFQPRMSMRGDER